MIKTFIFVEDGSVDIEELKNSVNTMNYFMRRDIEVLCEKYFGKKEMKK